MQVKENIGIVATKKQQAYTLQVRQRSKLGGVANENLTTATIKKKCMRQHDKGFVFELLVTDRKQTNIEGVRSLENDLSFLQQKLVVQTNLQGLPVSILNLGDIRDEWKLYQQKFKNNNKDYNGIDSIIQDTTSLLNNNKIFTDNFINSEIGTLFFPPIYDILGAKGETFDQEKEFKNFFGEPGLPLKITNTLKNTNAQKENAHIVRQGKINEDAFDYYTVRKQFRKLADNLQLAVPITVQYIETYDLHTYYGIEYAGQILAVEIPALFTYEQIARVTPLKTEL